MSCCAKPLKNVKVLRTNEQIYVFKEPGLLSLHKAFQKKLLVHWQKDLSAAECCLVLFSETDFD